MTTVKELKRALEMIEKINPKARIFGGRKEIWTPDLSEEELKDNNGVWLWDEELGWTLTI